MPHHTVKPGEHLAQIAFDAGHADFKRIFNLGENAELKAKRKNLHVLAPGDKVFIPDPEVKTDPAATDQRHTFKVEADKLKLRVALRDVNDKPVQNQKCTLSVQELPAAALTTDHAGIIEQQIPNNTLKGRLVAENESLALDIDAPLLIGALDPIDTVHGQLGRLNNLGYDAGDPAAPPGQLPPPDQKPDPDAALRFRSAVEEFQCDHGLPVDGKCGPNTQNKLKDVHGC